MSVLEAKKWRGLGMMRQLVAFAAALAVAPCATGSGMHTAPLDSASPCPDSLPRGACLGPERWEGAEWHGKMLPLNDSKTYVESLLQTAVEVEHSTIPLYLASMYSIINQSSFEATTMRGVVMEEMLHMVNAANVLNAIGGEPLIDSPDFVPVYPLVLPILNMTADIVWFTLDSITHFEILESV